MLKSMIFFLVLCTPIYAACTVRDDAGNTVTVRHGAQHIISLAPDITEILFTIGAGERIVGVMSGSDYPERAKQIPHVGSYAGIDLEKIIALKPDLIITWDQMFARDLAILKKLGLPVYVNKPIRIEDVAHSMRHFGCLVGKSTQANKAAKQFMTGLRALTNRYAHAQVINVFYQIGPYSLMTVNKQSWINQAITLCGGKNIFAEARLLAAEVSLEAILVARPQIIIAASMNGDWQERWKQYPSLNAQLFTIPSDLINRASPRILQGITQICSNIDLSRAKYA